MMLVWPEFVAEGTAGLNFCVHCTLLIDEVDELSQKISENRHNLKSLKCIQMRSSKQAATYCMSMLQLGMKVLCFVSSFLHYLFLSDKSNQSHAVARTFKLSTKYTEKK